MRWPHPGSSGNSRTLAGLSMYLADLAQTPCEPTSRGGIRAAGGASGLGLRPPSYSVATQASARASSRAEP